jgi:hypothetical protein
VKATPSSTGLVSETDAVRGAAVAGQSDCTELLQGSLPPANPDYRRVTTSTRHTSSHDQPEEPRIVGELASNC